MSNTEIERIAAAGLPMPESLSPPEIMLFQTMAALYLRYRSGSISREQAASEKKKIINAYSKMDGEYRQLLELCREYQRRLKEGYAVGGVSVLKMDKGAKQCT